IVLDGHGAAFSIKLEDLDPRAQLIRGRRLNELEGLDGTFDLMFAIGAHAMAGTPNGLLTHTLSHVGINNIWLNDKPVGEIGLWAALAGDYDVPLGLVTGDLAAVREAENLLGEVFTVAVKEATSRFAAKCLHPDVSRKLIREAARKTVENKDKFIPYKPGIPIELKVEYHNSERADRISEKKNMIRVDGRTVLARGNKMREVYSLLLH
ncbi:TPA: aminopeptidase, partial [Candidatus Bathyarchaeota archaeon]|nr:aminopeptidase [Candidatus Bathyarchaeota archaeon]